MCAIGSILGYGGKRRKREAKYQKRKDASDIVTLMKLTSEQVH